MNETWKIMATRYIDSYKSIKTLKEEEILDDEEYDKAMLKLLGYIIDDFESEVVE